MAIPARVQASAAVAHGETWQGELPLRLMPRLTPLLAGDDGRIKVELQATDAPGYPVLRGRVQGTLPLACKRCGKTYGWGLDAPIALRLVRSEAEEKSALHDSEPYLVEHDALPLRDVVEEELLLALPMLARCESCENAVRESPEPAPADPVPRPDPSIDGPFAALKKQLKK